MCCPAQKAAHGDGDTPDLALDCGGTASSTEPPVYLGSLPYYNHITNCLQQQDGVTRCLAQPPRGNTTTKKADTTTTTARLLDFTAHSSPRSTGICVMWGCISSSLGVLAG